jgi:glycosyltransferase involved in cell wall biosynthesis
MNLFIVHYHLFRGGVTRIISHQLESLKGNSLFETTSLMTGRIPDKAVLRDIHIDAPLVEEDLLFYLPSGAPAQEYKSSEKKLYSFFKKNITKNDIIHVHNPALGKNPLLTYTLGRLAREGYSFFYHCHDFAEDRPENYLFLKQIITDLFHADTQAVMYPCEKKTMFGVLTSYDAQRLGGMDIPGNRIVRLPNPVKVPALPGMQSTPAQLREMKKQARENVCTCFSLDPSLPIMLYPVRVIRRKNIGEFIFFASLFKKQASWLVTMPPTNPVEIAPYEQWKAFAEEIHSPVIFEAGDTMNFPSLMYAAHKAVTTSVKEGFGMCFLEPWTFHTPVTGRTIPGVIPDFKKDGIKFPHLYDRLPVFWQGKTGDFPGFSPGTQMEIIKKMLANPSMKDDFLSATGIEKKLFDPVPGDLVLHNKQVITDLYSIENYGKKLTDIYTALSR